MAPAEHTQLHDSPFDIVMADIGKQRWDYYKKNMIPVENKYIENVKWLGSKEAADQASGLATSGVRSQAEPMMDAAKKGMLESGVAPNSGAYKMHLSDMNQKMATGVADADVAARTGQKNEYLKGLEGVVNIGNGMANQAIGNISDVAGMARDRAMTNSEMNAKESAAVGSGLGTAAGLGIGTYARYNGRGA